MPVEKVFSSRHWEARPLPRMPPALPGDEILIDDDGPCMVPYARVGGTMSPSQQDRLPDSRIRASHGLGWASNRATRFVSLTPASQPRAGVCELADEPSCPPSLLPCKVPLLKTSPLKTGHAMITKCWTGLDLLRTRHDPHPEHCWLHLSEGEDGWWSYPLPWFRR